MVICALLVFSMQNSSPGDNCETEERFQSVLRQFEATMCVACANIIAMKTFDHSRSLH